MGNGRGETEWEFYNNTYWERHPDEADEKAFADKLEADRRAWYTNYDLQQRELWDRGRRDRNLAHLVNSYQTNERTKHWSYEKCVQIANDFLGSGHPWPVD